MKLCEGYEPDGGALGPDDGLPEGRRYCPEPDTGGEYGPLDGP